MLLPLVVFEGRARRSIPWSRPGAFAHAPEIAGKARYLTAPFVFARIAIVFAAWLLFARAFRRASLAQDRGPGARCACTSASIGSARASSSSSR